MASNVRLGLVVVLVAVVLAGCSGVSTTSQSDVETVTPAPVPEGTESTRDVPGADDGQVDGPLLGVTHAASLDASHTRVMDFDILVGEERYLDYREARTVGAGNESIRTRSYEGRETARFVPDVADASVALSERYSTDDVTAQRRTVDGATARVADGVPPLESPVPTTGDAEIVSALLSEATVEGRTQSGGVRLSADSVAPAAIPDYLEDPRNVSVGATVRPDGRVRHIVVRYDATLGDERVSVAQDVYWSPPAELVTAPEWYDGGSESPQ